MRFISLIDNPFSRVEPTCPSVRIEIIFKLFPIVSDGVYWTTLLAILHSLKLQNKIPIKINFLKVNISVILSAILLLS